MATRQQLEEVKGNAEKKATLAVRNAIFDVCDGKPVGAAMQGIIMAQAKLMAAACGGDVTKTRDFLDQYHAIMVDAIPIYCAEIEAGCPHPAKN